MCLYRGAFILSFIFFIHLFMHAFIHSINHLFIRMICNLHVMAFTIKSHKLQHYKQAIRKSNMLFNKTNIDRPKSTTRDGHNLSVSACVVTSSGPAHITTLAVDIARLGAGRPDAQGDPPGDAGGRLALPVR